MELFGHQIENSPRVKELIKSLVEEVSKINSQIEGVRPPQPEWIAEGAKEVDRAGAIRGRPLNYSYVGSGAGRGSYVELSDGSIKLDLINGIGIHLMGHGNPRVIEATVRGALSDIVNQGNLQPNKEYIRFMEKLVKMARQRSRLKYAWLSTCGTMANENALKLTRQKLTPARMVLCFKNAFAGRSTMMAELTDNAAYKVGLPEYHEMLRVPFFDKRDPKSSEKALAIVKDHVARHEKNISVFAFEPMLGEGGYQAAPRKFFTPILDFCKEHGIAIWADEVQTFSRTGELFAFETLDLGQYVDIVTIAKTAQVGATLYTEEYNPKPGLIAGTFSGATAALSAGIEILTMLEEGNYFGPQGRINNIHQQFMSAFHRLGETTCKGKISDPGGMGLMIAFTPYEGKKEQVDALLKRFFNNGLVGFNCGKDPIRIRFLVPAIISDGEIKAAVDIIEKSLLEA